MEEYSISGCESGWTIYFEQSRGCADDDGCVNRSDEEEDEDSSMLSDASSGPAQLSPADSPTNCQTNDNGWSFGNGGGGLFCSVSTDEDAAALAKRRKRGKRADDQPQLLDEDDTASSSPDSGHSYSYSYSSSMNNDHRGHRCHHRSSPMDFSEDHLSASYFQGGGASTSSTAAHTHYHQIQFHHQQYHWY